MSSGLLKFFRLASAQARYETSPFQKPCKWHQNVECTASGDRIVQLSLVHERRAYGNAPALRKRRYLFGDFPLDFASDADPALDLDYIDYTRGLDEKVDLKAFPSVSSPLQRKWRSRPYCDALQMQMRYQRHRVVDDKVLKLQTLVRLPPAQLRKGAKAVSPAANLPFVRLDVL